MRNNKNLLLISNLILSLGIFILAIALFIKEPLAEICQGVCSPTDTKKFFSQKPNHGLNQNLLQDEILKFAVIADSHLGGTYSSGRYFQNALDKAKEKKVDFLVIAGDLVESGENELLARVKEILDESGLTYFTVPGDHDKFNRSGESDIFKNYKRYFGDLYRKEEIFLTNTNSKWKKAKLILINNSVLVAPEKRIDDEQMLWLEQELYYTPKAEDELTFVFMHVPLNWLGSEEQNRLRYYFCTAKVNGVFSGNIHSTEQFYSKCKYPKPLQEDKTPQVFPTFTVGTTYLTNKKEFPGFIVMHFFEGGQIELEKVVL